MMMMVTPPPAQREELATLSEEQLAEKLVAGVKRRRTNWKQQKAETGIINGMRFARIRWEGTDPQRQAQMRGFIYAARDGDFIVQFSSQDFLPETDNALALAEASVLTLKKKR